MPNPINYGGAYGGAYGMRGNPYGMGSQPGGGGFRPGMQPPTFGPGSVGGPSQYQPPSGPGMMQPLGAGGGMGMRPGMGGGNPLAWNPAMGGQNPNTPPGVNPAAYSQQQPGSGGNPVASNPTQGWTPQMWGAYNQAHFPGFANNGMPFSNTAGGSRFNTTSSALGMSAGGGGGPNVGPIGAGSIYAYNPANRGQY